MIGERLRHLRRQRGLSQKELADIIGVYKSAVSHYETDKDSPSDKIKISIARYFNVSVDYLLGLIDEAVPFYDQDVYLWLPKDMRSDEKSLMMDFLDFIEYKRHKCVQRWDA